MGERTSSGGRARVAVPADPAHHRGRHPLRLAHDDARGRRDLVGERHDRDLELATGVIRRAAQIHRRGHPRDADRHVDEALAPGTTERVGDHDAESPKPQPLREGLAEAPRRTIGVLGKQRQQPVGDVGGVHATVRTDEPVRRLDDDQVPATRDDALRFGRDDRIAIRGPGDPGLRLGHHLLGHHDDVALGRGHRRDRVGQEPREIVSRSDLGQALDTSDADRHPRSSSAPRATASACASSTISVSIAAHRSPRVSTAGIDAASRSSSSHPDSRSR